MTDTVFEILRKDKKALAKVKALEGPADLLGFVARRSIPAENADHPYSQVTRAMAMEGFEQVDWPELLIRLKAA